MLRNVLGKSSNSNKFETNKSWSKTRTVCYNVASTKQATSVEEPCN